MRITDDPPAADFARSDRPQDGTAPRWQDPFASEVVPVTPLVPVAPVVPVTPVASTNVEVTGTVPPPPPPVPALEPVPAAAPVHVPSRYVQHGYVNDPNEYRMGVGLLFGGGVIDYTKSHIRDVTGTGGAWDVRLIFGPREVLALETAYVGTARNVSGVGLASDALLVSNGAEGALRLNIPIIDGLTIVEPFGFVGLGWSRYHVSRTQVTSAMSSFNQDDDILEVPYGAGIAIGYGGFLADARFTYRATYYNDLLKATGSSQSRLDAWSVGAHIGFEF